eukprot:NODE_936_length_3012_cov_0.939581.p2 type:complete len:235 gc:universal NODE_936_length_3012_cov_0.939581:2232-2936(+)
MISAIKEIRKLKPLVGMSRIKAVLQQHNNDVNESLQYLEKNELQFGKNLYETKLKDRIVKFGTIDYFRNAEKWIVYATWCETDFVANTKEFQSLRSMLGISLANQNSVNTEDNIEVDKMLFKHMGYLKELVRVKIEDRGKLRNNLFVSFYQHDSQRLCIAITSKFVSDIIPKSLFAHGREGLLLNSDCKISDFLDENDTDLLSFKIIDMQNKAFQLYSSMTDIRNRICTFCISL